MPRAGVNQQTRLPGAEGHGGVGLHSRTRDFTGISIDTAWHVDRNHQGGRRNARHGSNRLIAKCTPATDPDDAVDHQVGASQHGRLVDTTTGCSQLGKAFDVRAVT